MVGRGMFSNVYKRVNSTTGTEGGATFQPGRDVNNYVLIFATFLLSQVAYTSTTSDADCMSYETTIVV